MEDWFSGPASNSAAGDTGPWARWLPLAWEMAADLEGTRTPPPDPHRSGRLNELIAWWAPLLQLTLYGLGWTHPLRGLARWDHVGRPVDEPVLAVVQQWWGPRLDDILAWGADWTPGSMEGPDLRLTPTGFERGTLFQPYWARRSQTDWQQVWGGGGDPLHLWIHARPPFEGPDFVTGAPLERLLTLPPHPDVAARLHANQTPGRRHHEVLLLPRYGGWYRHILAAGPPRRAGHDRRIDVVVAPLGWLGQYRRSTRTGLWFRGHHQTHLLGNH